MTLSNGIRLIKSDQFHYCTEFIWEMFYVLYPGYAFKTLFTPKKKGKYMLHNDAFETPLFKWTDFHMEGSGAGP